MDLNVFISWSGARSRKLAEAVYEFIPDVIQEARPWLSSEDIDRGRRWGIEIAGALKQARIGVLCLTQESIDSPWVLFEAGALAKTLDTAYVIPYLLGIDKVQVPPPLGDFQACSANRDDTLSLIKSLNNALGRPVKDPNRLTRIFNRCWPDLGRQVTALEAEKPHGAKAAKPRSADDLLEEILTRLRGLERAVPFHNPHSPPATDTSLFASRLTRRMIRKLAAGQSVDDVASYYDVDAEDVERRIGPLLTALGTKDFRELDRHMSNGKR